MNQVLSTIVEMAAAAQGKPDFLDAVFGDNREEAQRGKTVVIFGAGSLGQEMRAALTRNNIQIAAFCDNDERKVGSPVSGLPVISFDHLLRRYQDSLVVVAVAKHRSAIAQQLLSAGFSASDIGCSDADAEFAYMYAMIGTQTLLAAYEKEAGPDGYLAYLQRHQDQVGKAFDLLEDEKSRSLYVTKLALMASAGSFDLFRRFISEFSEPYRDFGLVGYDGTAEDYYYFNNDVLAIDDAEILVDVGAYDGDTIETFIDACQRSGKTFEHIYAFEPDPGCFSRLNRKYGDRGDITCRQEGLWSQTTTLRFQSSQNAIHDQAAEISDEGDIRIPVVSLDDFLQVKRVTFIKMDPGGNIIPHVLRGAEETISRWHPKLAVGVYHGGASMFEIPLLIHEMNAKYRMYLRHNTCHLCDTDLYAV